jgi:hypothetical protein
MRLARNKTKREYRVWCYEAMRIEAAKMAERKWGKRSFSLYAFMAIHNALRRDGVDFKALGCGRLDHGVTDKN